MRLHPFFMAQMIVKQSPGVCVNVAASVAILVLGGCAASHPLKNFSFPTFSKSSDAALRQQVEVDAFPTAKQAGVKSADAAAE